MMNSYKEITGRYLKANKKRTALTIIGIILSVALISSIGFFFKSMQAAQIEDIKNSYGAWHVMFKKGDENLLTKVKSNPNVEESGIYSVGKTLPMNEKLKVREVYGTDEALKLLPYKIKEGRFPEKNTEVAMESWFVGKVKNGAKPGDRIKILNKEYTLVGILNDTYSNQQEGMGELLTKGEGTEQQGRIFVVRLKVNKELLAHVNEMKKLASEQDVIDNGNLTSMEGQGIQDDLLVTLVIIIAIVVISTIAVIFNSFQISVVDRVKQFGLLRAVGATPKQIRKIILREATFLAAIGIPIGLAFGVIALYGIHYTFKLIGGGDLVFIKPTVSLDVIIISILVGLLSIYISALIPAIFAGKISPLVAISSRNSITKEKIKKSRRKSFLIHKLFGFEGTLASKNLKRNRKRYRTTVFSIVISVTLFITFKSFMDQSMNVYSEVNESNKIHFSIVTTENAYISKGKIDTNIIQQVNTLPQVDVSYKVYNPYYFDAVMDKRKELDSIKSLGDVYKDVSYKGEKKTLTAGSVMVYDEKSLEVAKGYLKDGNIDRQALNKENGVIIIAKNTIYNKKTEKNFYGPLADFKIGDEILLQSDEAQMDQTKKKVDFGQGQVKKVKVLAILERDPFTFKGPQQDVKMITTEEVAKALTGKDVNPVALNIKIKDVNQEEQSKAQLENVISGAGDLKVINVIDVNRMSKSGILMIKILLYGFVVVVSLIGCVNIINTLTTNIILRRREFAALKSIGLTQKGLRKMITLEGMLYGIMGSIYGAISGTILSYLIYNGISNVREQSYMVPFEAIAIAAAGTIFIGYLSVLAPLKRLKKDNIIDVVREDF